MSLEFLGNSLAALIRMNDIDKDYTVFGCRNELHCLRNTFCLVDIPDAQGLQHVGKVQPDQKILFDNQTAVHRLNHGRPPGADERRASGTINPLTSSTCMRRNMLILEDGDMALFADDISLTFRGGGVRYPVAKRILANEIPLIFVFGVEKVAGATRQIAQWHL